jgi:hypothetical protein
MTDHLANNALSLAFGTSYARIPLRQSAHIRHADALETDWNEILPAARCHYVLGNPPFLGAKFQTAEQRRQVRTIARLPGAGGTLDYVAAWFLKAADYMATALTVIHQPTRHPSESWDPETPGRTGSLAPTSNPRLRIAFVATNSLTQGEQVAQLWPLLFRRGLEIAFAHRTFEWSSEAKGKAHVHCVILGLAHRNAVPAKKRLFSYPSIRGVPVETTHEWLSPYLVPVKEAQRHLVVKEEARPINGARPVRFGTQPIDGGHYILAPAERAALVAKVPEVAPFAVPFIGGVHQWSRALHSGPWKRADLAPDPTGNQATDRRGFAFSCGKPATSDKGAGQDPNALCFPNGSFLAVSDPAQCQQRAQGIRPDRLGRAAHDPEQPGQRPARSHPLGLRHSHQRDAHGLAPPDRRPA